MDTNQDDLHLNTEDLVEVEHVDGHYHRHNYYQHDHNHHHEVDDEHLVEVEHVDGRHLTRRATGTSRTVEAGHLHNRRIIQLDFCEIEIQKL